MAHREDGFGGSHTVVSDKDLADDAVSSAGFDVVFNQRIGGVGAGEGGFVEGGCSEGRAGGLGYIFVEEGALDLTEYILFGGR